MTWNTWGGVLITGVALDRKEKTLPLINADETDQKPLAGMPLGCIHVSALESWLRDGGGAGSPYRASSPKSETKLRPPKLRIP
jgi:hypothetical protein